MKIWYMSSNIFLRTVAPEMSIFTSKLVFIVKIIICFKMWSQDQYCGPKIVQSLSYKYIGKCFKKCNASICEISMQASSNSVDCKFLTSWRPNQYLGHRKGSNFNYLSGKCLKIIFLRTTMFHFVMLLCKHSQII